MTIKNDHEIISSYVIEFYGKYQKTMPGFYIILQKLDPVDIVFLMQTIDMKCEDLMKLIIEESYEQIAAQREETADDLVCSYDKEKLEDKKFDVNVTQAEFMKEYV